MVRPPEEVGLDEVIQLLEGSLAPVECVDNPEVCSRSDYCATRDTWSEMKKALEGVLRSTTLQNLAERQEKKERIKEAMYYI
jgi:DNA-binding IscR family transcriptional regulator